MATSSPSGAVAKAPEAAPEKAAGSRPARPQSAYELMRSLTQDLDRTFNEFWGHRRWPFAGLTAPGTSTGVWTPPIETEERDGTLYVRTELPGLSKSDVKVEVTEDILTIEGERKQESDKKEGTYYRSERSYGYFSRSVALPEGAKVDAAKATFKDGVLEIAIELPARKAPEARRVTIGDA
jgi:HSP20 family protein